MSLRPRFEEIRNSPSPTAAELDELWADSEVATVEDMLGHWKGGDFPLGHPASAMLDKINWHGKWFDSPLDVSPIVVRGDNGELEADAAAAGGAAASVWSIEFRGESTATMVYDAMGIFDHFKKVDGDTVLGIMNGKLDAVFGTRELYYFWLEREK